jgi:hypothetical protein
MEAGTDLPRDSRPFVTGDKPRQDLDNTRRANAAGDRSAQALAGKFVGSRGISGFAHSRRRRTRNHRATRNCGGRWSGRGRALAIRPRRRRRGNAARPSAIADAHDAGSCANPRDVGRCGFRDAPRADTAQTSVSWLRLPVHRADSTPIHTSAHRLCQMSKTPVIHTQS